MYELVVIGGGPAGLAAALSAYENGLRRILIIERDTCLGGILNQCIHSGFGLHTFREELTGPEYAERYTERLPGTSIEVKLDTMVVSLEAPRGEPVRRVTALNPTDGLLQIETRAVVLAMGCRERTAGAIGIPGDRPAGVLTAGTAQRYINLEGYCVGRTAVILGSGDIGLIMARRLTLEGAKVLACLEIQPFSGGLTRNIVQCLDDFGIPLYLSHTITEIKAANGRLCRVTAAAVDENKKPVPGTQMVFDCDTLLLSVGLIPENELTQGAGITMDHVTSGPVVMDNMETSASGVFACGNVVHVHDLVDNVSAQSERAGAAAAEYVLKGGASPDTLRVCRGENVTVAVPQLIRRSAGQEKTELFFRTSKAFGKSVVTVRSAGRPLKEFTRPYMTPGETQKISLSEDVLKDVSGEITVSCRHA